ncbi:GNAT family protein [Streptomyces sp. NPDC001904]|uniref:GNAT family N-acetyltransferase n=1 Tax=Streptomyces sp. NPDC001904 TaxID=3154531 RepID=UPI00331B4AD4
MLIAPDIEMRRATVDDAQALADAQVRNIDHLRSTEPPRTAEFYTAEGQVSRITGADSATWVLVDRAADGIVIGRLMLSGIVMGPLCSTSLGYWVDGTYAGRGLTTAAVEEIIRICRDELGLHRIEAGTLTDNHSSQRVLAKCGFERFGMSPKYLYINGAWRDHIRFARLLHDDPPPSVPK